MTDFCEFQHIILHWFGFDPPVFGQSLWPIDGQAFVAAVLSAEQFDLAGGGVKGLGDEALQALIGLAIHRRGLHGYPQAVRTPGAEDGVSAGSGLQTQTQDQGVALPLIPSHAVGLSPHPSQV